MPVIPEPYAPAAEELGIPQDAAARTTSSGMQERRLLRRVAAILFHRRAGFSANGMGVWKVPDERIMELGPRMAAFRGISHCYQRPTYEDWPYSIFTMAHGRSKEECDAILDSIAARDRDQRARDALLLDRVQEDPAALLHRGLPGLGTRARRRVSAAAYDHARARPSSTPRARAAARRRQLAGPGDALDRARPDLHRLAATARRSPTSTATSTSTGSARGGR